MINIVWLIYFVSLSVTLGWFAYKLRFALTHFKIKRESKRHIDPKGLPSVSVCVPARNETHAMIDCLQRLLEVDYPKLEIIVFDDDSGDNTSVLIKSFAHAGVRFVEGSGLPTDWLGKNRALNDLAKEASGKYILYADVDTLVNRNTVSELINYAIAEQADMVSVLPCRADGWRFSVLFTTLRYFREVITHNSKHPAVASNAWLINRKVLESFDRFENCKNHIQPEAYFAAAIAAVGNYRFIISDKVLGVNYEKKWHSQLDTAIRLYYPLFGSSLFKNVLAFIFTILIASPAFVLVAAISLQAPVYIQSAVAFTCATIYIIYTLFLYKTWARAWWFGALLWPVVAVQEALLILLSTIKHTQRKVTWKGRPITSEQQAVEY